MAQTIDGSHAQLIADLQRQAEELAQLNRIAIALTSEFDLKRLLQMITDAARKVTEAQYAAFFLIPALVDDKTNVQGQKFELAAISGATERIEQHFRHLGQVEGRGVLHPVFWEGKSFVVDDVYLDERYIGVEREVSERTAELEYRNQELNKFATNLQQLHHELTEAQKRQMLTEERGRIAQELHDHVQQTFFTVALKADWVRERLPDDSALARQLHTIKQLASLGTAQVRDAIFALSSAELPGDSLVSILYKQVCDLRETSSLDADLVVGEWATPLPDHLTNTLFMVAQEALSNVRRHACASIVIVTIHVTSEHAILVVQDNGVGLSDKVLQTYGANTIHLGLKGMHHRVEELGGQLSLVNGEEGGLIVKAVVPL